MTTSKPRSSMTISRTDSQTFEQCRNPAFVQAVNRAANLKILVAIKSGKLRVVEPPKQTSPLVARYTPRMDIIDDPSSSNLAAIFEVPGITTENIKLTIHEGQLHLYGERRAPYPTRVESFPNNSSLPFNVLTLGDKLDTGSPSQVKVHVQEICFGTFQRSIPLPKGIKMQDIHANLSDGLLTVTWPRSPAQTCMENHRAAAGKSVKSFNSSPPMHTMAAGTASQ
ncbi:hypothetical protein JR316_0013266 [Psilocybe cubensis]|uniref:SHSP domain-containing protein n=2 Tax=Psilocybe cubensis TaxID=181762 RepID=A0A8H7XSC3_PSICU|nr:hypothetical protein JR316_0013266 [Psilocybe cubensis]KAH9474801.1 hypothetical protein JR316_0013266 [Psilocybe cubensis]